MCYNNKRKGRKMRKIKMARSLKTVYTQVVLENKKGLH